MLQPPPSSPQAGPAATAEVRTPNPDSGSSHQQQQQQAITTRLRRRSLTDGHDDEGAAKAEEKEMEDLSQPRFASHSNDNFSKNPDSAVSSGGFILASKVTESELALLMAGTSAAQRSSQLRQQRTLPPTRGGAALTSGPSSVATLASVAAGGEGEAKKKGGGGFFSRSTQKENEDATLSTAPPKSSGGGLFARLFKKKKTPDEIAIKAHATALKEYSERASAMFHPLLPQLLSIGGAALPAGRAPKEAALTAMLAAAQSVSTGVSVLPPLVVTSPTSVGTAAVFPSAADSKKE